MGISFWFCGQSIKKLEMVSGIIVRKDRHNHLVFNDLLQDRGILSNFKSTEGHKTRVTNIFSIISSFDF